MLRPETKSILFRLAVKYKKTRLWSAMFSDQQLFAVQLPDGQPAWCCVMGSSGQHVALAVYVGLKGISSWLYLTQDTEYLDSEEDHSFMLLKLLSQNCLQCVFDDREYVSPEQIREAKTFVKGQGLSLTSPFRYPHFDRYATMCRPTPIQDEEDAAILIQGLKAAICVSRLIRREEILLPLVTGSGCTVPLLIPSEDSPDGFELRTTVIPEPVPLEVPRPAPLPRATVAKLRACRKYDPWDCALACLPNEVLEDQNPWQMLSAPVAYNSKSHMAISLPVIGVYEADPDGMLNQFAEALVHSNIRPSLIRVHRLDLRGQVFFSILADSLEIPIRVEDHLPELNDLIMSLTRNQEGPSEEVQAALQFILTATPAQLRALPPDMKTAIRSLLQVEDPMITKAMKDKIRRSLGS